MEPAAVGGGVGFLGVIGVEGFGVEGPPRVELDGAGVDGMTGS